MSNLERVAWYYGAGRLFLPRPRYFCFNSTLRCDLKCLHCGIWEDKLEGEELSPDQLAEILRQPFFQRIHTAWLTGGEPTLRKDAGELAEVLASRLPSLRTLGIATNGVQTDRVAARVREMLKAIDTGRQSLFVHISVDGYREVHDLVRSRQGAFDGVVATLEEVQAIAKENPAVVAGLNCVIQPDNVDDLGNIYRFAKDRGVSLTFNTVVITDQIFRTAARSEQLSLDEGAKKKIRDFLESIMPEAPPVLRYSYRIIIEVLKGGRRPRRCLTLYSTVNINANGVLIPCPAASDMFPVDVFGLDLDELWRSSEAEEMRRRVLKDFCPSCMLSCSVGDAMSIRELLQRGWDF